MVLQHKKILLMLNENTIIALHWIVDELLKGIGHREAPCRKMRDSEVITTEIVSALYFECHLYNSRVFMKMTGFVPGSI